MFSAPHRPEIPVPHRRPVLTFTAVAVLAGGADQITKALAARTVGERIVPLGTDNSAAWLMVVQNQLAAFGLSFGAHTRAINIGLTLAALLLIVPVVRALARVDARAPWALGLIAGGALGNLLNLLVSPAGVTDFFAFSIGGGRALVMNMADLVVYVGLAVLCRIGLALARAIRAQGGAAAREPGKGLGAEVAPLG